MGALGDVVKVGDAVSVGIVNKKDKVSDGRMAEFQVFNRALSPAEIEGLAESNPGETCESKRQ